MSKFLIRATSACFLLLSGSSSLIVLGATTAIPSEAWVDVSDGVGVPLGGLGCGYSIFGQYGFTHVNFEDRPDNYAYKPK